jgi:hypothetical protein
MIEIIRKSGDTGANATYGTIIVEGVSLHTMERPWIPSATFPSGKPSESCVPVGEYELVKAYSPKFDGDMYYLVNEENGVFLRKEDRNEDWQRWGCMFHSANWVHQINGCIATGERKGIIGSKMGVGASKRSINKLYAYLDTQEEPTLSIKWD